MKKHLLGILVLCGASFFATASFAQQRPETIFCERDGNSVQGNNSIFFTRQDCGGFLPGPRYKGALSSMVVNGGTVSFKVMQPDGPGAGVYFYASQAGNRTFSVAALFFRLPNIGIDGQRDD